MKYAFVLDSAACIPEAELKRRPIKIFPVTVTFEGIQYDDTTDQEALIAIYKAGRISVKANALSITPTADDIRRYILTKVATNYDVAICQTLSQSYSAMFSAFKAVAESMPEDSKQVRMPLGIEAPFRMSLIDSGSLAAGQGLIALYADDLMSAGLDITDYRPIVDDFTTLVKSFTVVYDSVYIRQNVKIKARKTLSLSLALIANALSLCPIGNCQNGDIEIVDIRVRGFDTAVNRVLKYCCERVLEGLVAPLINISYAGDPKALESFKYFIRLKRLCEANDIALYVGTMTLAASINLGPGTLSVGIAPINQDIQP